MRRPPNPSLVLISGSSVLKIPILSPVMNMPVYVCSYCVRSYICQWECSAIEAGSLLRMRSGTRRYVLRQGDAVKTRHAALIFLLPFCTSVGFSHYRALNVFLGCIFFLFMNWLLDPFIYQEHRKCIRKKPHLHV